jgi:hypothetical protein
MAIKSTTEKIKLDIDRKAAMEITNGILRLAGGSMKLHESEFYKQNKGLIDLFNILQANFNESHNHIHIEG